MTISAVPVSAYLRAGAGGNPTFFAAPGYPNTLIDANFVDGTCFVIGQGLVPISSAISSVVRASAASSLLPTDQAGAPNLSFPNNIPVIVPGRGLYVFEGRTNFLINSLTPATQTTGSLAVGTYVAWCLGSGSVAIASGTAIITGAGSASQGAPLTFQVTTAGTVAATVTGSLYCFQLENGNSATSLIITAGATATRAADVLTSPAFPFGSGAAYTALCFATPYNPNNYGASNTPLQIDDGTNNNRIDIDRNASNGIVQASISLSGWIINPNTLVVWPPYANGAYGMSFGSAFMAVASNIGLVSSGPFTTISPSSPPLFQPARICWGCNGNLQHQWNGIIQRVVILNTALTGTALQQIVQP